MKLSELTKKFNYSSVPDFCAATNSSLSIWTNVLRERKFSPKVYCAEDILKKRNMELYQEAERKAEQEYWEREKIIKELKSMGRFRKNDLMNPELEWKDITKEKPNNEEIVLTYDGRTYCLMYYYETKPKMPGFKWTGEGFYGYDCYYRGNYKESNISHWTRINKILTKMEERQCIH